MLYHFDASRVAIVAQGINCQEMAKGEFLTLTQREKPFTVEEGTHGIITRIRVPAQLWDLKLVIQKGSPVNGLLSAKVKADMITGDQVGPLLVKDLEGSSLVTGVCFFFPPVFKVGTELGGVEWEGIAGVRADQWYEGAGRFLIPQ